MKRPVSAALRTSLIWLGTAVLAVLILANRLELSFDLSAFLPQQTTLAHDVLIEQIRKGPGSRLIVIGINGADAGQLAETSDQLKQALSVNPAFVAVLNGEISEDKTQIPEPVNSYYLLMRDIDYSRESLRQALQSRLQDLAFVGGSDLLKLIARDPFLVTLDVLEQLAPVDMSGDMWFAADGSAVLMAETHAPSIDLAAQTDAIHSVQQTFAALPDVTALNLELTGVGAFSVELQKTIRAEATKRSIMATAMLLLVLLVVFRKLRLVLLATLPIGMGFLAGLTLISLLFDTVHGITLAFGFTLLGVAVDYPLHLFSHAEHDSGGSAIRRIWPTMRLGVISTAIAYLALAFSGSPGLAQLGLFTAGGVTIAVLVTRTWLPLLLPKQQMVQANAAMSPQAPTLQYVVAVVVLLLAAFAILRNSAAGLWDDNLSSLSPVPAARIAADRALRSAVVTPDMRYQLVLHNDSLESLLHDSNVVDALLAKAVEDGLLHGWQSVSQMLPSEQDQRHRRDAIPDPDILSANLQHAIAGTPFRPDAFAPFVANARTAKTLPTLFPVAIAATPLRSWLDSHLLQIDDQWVALISIARPEVNGLADRVQQWDVPVELVDLQESSVDLMRDYRVGARNTILVAALIIICLLWYVRGQLQQTIWIALTVTAALAVTVATITSLHGSLTVIHLVALLLVLGLGLDYALFLSRSESSSERRATGRGVLACAASTTLAFGILAGSSIPVLKFLGLTVAAGSAANFLIAWSGSRLRWKWTAMNSG
jgi:predicted exporter